MRRLIFFLAVAGLLLLSGRLPAQDAGFKVVVSSSNPAESISKLTLSRYFLKKKTTWENGSKVLPADQAEKSEVRNAFSKEIHGKEVAWIKSYWQRLFFSGRATAPPELGSDSEVLSYVRANTSAIGYVSKEADLGEGVKAVEVTE